MPSGLSQGLISIFQWAGHSSTLSCPTCKRATLAISNGNDDHDLMERNDCPRGPATEAAWHWLLAVQVIQRPRAGEQKARRGRHFAVQPEQQLVHLMMQPPPGVPTCRHTYPLDPPAPDASQSPPLAHAVPQGT